MQISKPLPPHDLKMRVSAETLTNLRFYQRYKKDVANELWDLKDMVGAIVSVFLAEGDPDFLVWRKRQSQKSTAVASVSATPTEDGATDA